MDRRHFLRLSAGLAAAPLAVACDDLTTLLEPTTQNGLGARTASVDMLQLQAAEQAQQCPLWCWAAAASMIFEFHGHPISQAAIVQRNLGQLVCAPAGGSSMMAQALSGTYIDARGRAFTSRIVAAYDYWNRIYAISNATIIDELTSNRPLLYCNASHAEVLYSMTYSGSPQAPNVQRVDVVDPWPTNARQHALNAAEMVPAHAGGQLTFVAAVQVY